MGDTITVTLTKGELERLYIVMAHHVDHTMTENLKDAVKRNQTERMTSIAEALAKDKALLSKLLNAM